MMRGILFVLLGLVSGSVMYAWVFPKWFCHVDIAKCSDDGNPGTANALKFGGLSVGILSLLFELAKGAVPVLMPKYLIPLNSFCLALIVAAPVAGHAFAPWGGGKAIAVSFGVLLGLLPQSKALLFLVIPYVFFSAILILRPHALRSIVSFISFFILTLLFEKNLPIIAAALFITGIVTVRHLSSLHKCIPEGQIFGKRIF